MTTQNSYSPVFFQKEEEEEKNPSKPQDLNILICNSVYEKLSCVSKETSIFNTNSPPQPPPEKKEKKNISLHTPGVTHLYTWCTHAARRQRIIQTDQLSLACCFACAVVNSLLVEFVVIAWAAVHTHAFVVVNYSCIKMSFCQQQLSDDFKLNESVCSGSH